MSKEANIQKIETTYGIESGLFAAWPESKQQALSADTVITLLQHLHSREVHLQNAEATASIHHSFAVLASFYDANPEKFNAVTCADIGLLLAIPREDNTLATIGEFYDQHGSDGVTAIANMTVRNIIAHRLPLSSSPLKQIIALYEQNPERFNTIPKGHLYSGSEADPMHLHEFYDVLIARPTGAITTPEYGVWKQQRQDFLNTYQKPAPEVLTATQQERLASCTIVSSIMA